MTVVTNETTDATISERLVTRRESVTPEADEALLHSLKNREDCGYEALVRTHGPLVLAIARRYLRSEADAADCFQDTFVAILNSIDNFKQRSSLRHWIRGVTINQCLMKIRTRQRRREDSIEHMLPIFNDKGKRLDVAGPSDIMAIADTIDSVRVQKTVRSCIDELPYDYRTVLLLRDIDGYSTSEAADIIGIQLSATKTRLHRARAALKKSVEQRMEVIGSHVNV